MPLTDFLLPLPRFIRRLQRGSKERRRNRPPRQWRKQHEIGWRDWLQITSTAATTLISLGGGWFLVPEQNDRKNAREVRAWTLLRETLTNPGEGNIGQNFALETLHRSGARLSGIDLTGRFLKSIELPNADLSFTSFGDATLSGTILSGADPFRADLSGANFSGARNLTTQQVAETCLSDPEEPPRNLPGSILRPCPPR